MLEKARTSLKVATHLRGLGWFDAGANRIYFSLYQAVVGAFKGRGMTPADLGAEGRKDSDYWPHEHVIGNLHLLNLETTSKAVIRQAKAMRVKADYKADSVGGRELAEILSRAPGILTELGAGGT